MPSPIASYTARAKHIHILHTPPTPLIPRTTLIPSTSVALYTIPEPRVTPTCSMFCTNHRHTSPRPPTPALPSPSHPHSLSAYTHATQTNNTHITASATTTPTLSTETSSQTDQVRPLDNIPHISTHTQQ